ncbi:MAG: YchJ family protein [Candidatus Margulisiibacteriota bacterium]
MSCYCGHPDPYLECCGQYVVFGQKPETAEKLMRSRYSAYATGAVPYLIQTTHPDFRNSTLGVSISTWIAQVSAWRGLTIVSVQKGGPKDEIGWVNFQATFVQDGQEQRLQERSRFSRFLGEWVYEDREEKWASS